MKVLFAQLKFAWKIYFALIFKPCDTLTLFHVADRSLEKLVLGSLIKRGARVNAPLIAIPRWKVNLIGLRFRPTEASVVEAANGRTMEFRKSRAWFPNG